MAGAIGEGGDALEVHEHRARKVREADKQRENGIPRPTAVVCDLSAFGCSVFLILSISSVSADIGVSDSISISVIISLQYCYDCIISV